MTAGGDPKELLAHPPNPMVHRFLTRGEGGTNMSTKVSPTLIGAFVIGAVALIVIAILRLRFGTAVSSD